jgi:hypothetical protein
MGYRKTKYSELSDTELSPNLKKKMQTITAVNIYTLLYVALFLIGVNMSREE